MRTIFGVILFFLFASIMIVSTLSITKCCNDQRENQFTGHTDGPAMKAAEKEALGE